MTEYLKLSPNLPGIPSGSGVKNLPAMPKTQEVLVFPLGWDDPLEEGMATHCSILENPKDREPWWAIVHRVEKCQTGLK